MLYVTVIYTTDVKGKDMDKSVQKMENVKKYKMEDINVQVKGLIEEGDAEQKSGRK